MQTMFGLFQSRPPLSTSQRVDLEWLIRRSREVFGEKMFHRDSVILSKDEIDVDATSIESKVSSIADWILPRFVQDTDSSKWMESLQWQISTNDTFDEPADYKSLDNENSIVTIHASVVNDDLQAIMVVAGALARHAWERFRQRDSDVDPQTTSLLPIIAGLGVLASQASLLDNQWSTVGWSGWSLSRSGYYNTMEIGYAMALVNRIANTAAEKPTWLPALRLDSRTVCKQAMQYFKRMDLAEMPLLLDADRIPNRQSEPSEIAAWLAGDDVAFAYAAALVASKHENANDDVIDAALVCTGRSDVELVARATEVLRLAPRGRKDVKDRLIKLADHKSVQVTFAAMKSATQFGLPHRDFVASATRILAAESFDLYPVLAWIESGGHQCIGLKPILLQHLEDAKRFNHTQAIKSLECCIDSM